MIRAIQDRRKAHAHGFDCQPLRRDQYIAGASGVMHKFLSDGQRIELEILSDAVSEEEELRTVPSRLRLALTRLRAQRWLIATGGMALFLLHLAFPVPAAAAAAGFAALIAAAALSPREGIVRVTRAPADPPAAVQDLRDIAGAMIEGIPEPAIILSAAGNILLWNGKAAETFEGLRPARHISGVVRHPALLDAVAKAARGEQRQMVSYAEHVPVERHIAAAVTVIGGDANANRPAILIFMRDLTGQERLDDMGADFIAYASHELKTPLASLIGFIETLQGPARNDAAARDRFLPIMLSQASRMSRLIDNLLSLSRVEMKAHLRPQTPVDAGEAAMNAVQALELLASDSSVTLETGDLDCQAFVLGDRDELIQVFQNLIHNAIKYGRPGGKVRVALRRLGGDARSAPRIEISVEDDGHGIAQQHLPRLTERFYRVSEGASAEKSGAGLGLAIAQQIVTRHRGELKIASELGKGAAFTVILAETAAPQQINERESWDAQADL